MSTPSQSLHPHWQGKPYYSLDAFLKQTYGEKIYKLPINGGFTCPNRDGTLSYGGCIFCSSQGSGDFLPDSNLSIKEQILYGRSLLLKKSQAKKFIAYFQAFTNTYAPIDRLKQLFFEAISQPEICILSIATRPDCLNDEIYELLSRLNQLKPVWVELGLQTIHEDSAAFIRRGYPLSCYEKAVCELKARNITVITHLILGLPTEDADRMLSSIRYLSSHPVDGIKLQLLQVLKGTALAEYYEQYPFSYFSLESYCEFLIHALRLLPPDMVIHRLTGDPPRSLLLSPSFCTQKRTILNTLHHRMKELHAFQGDHFSLSSTQQKHLVEE